MAETVHRPRLPPVNAKMGIRQMRPARKLLLGSVLILAGFTSACVGPAVHGSFDRTLTVSGPVRLYLANGSGSSRISSGQPGQVRIHADFRVRAWLGSDAHRSVAEIEQNPPIHQEGSLIRIGMERSRVGHMSADYTIEVPPDTSLRSVSGSGNIAVNALAGPVTITSGSGDVNLGGIQGDVQATAGSGDIRMEDLKGAVEITAGSGDVTLHSVGGRVRVTTGSGDIVLSSPGNAVTLHNGSGDIRVTGAAADLRIHSGSGTLSVSGAPFAGAYWELRTGSGDVRLMLPPDASFRLYAQSRRGEIRSDIPWTILERRQHEVRAVVGQGAARVEVATGSGDVRLSRP